MTIDMAGRDAANQWVNQMMAARRYPTWETVARAHVAGQRYAADHASAAPPEEMGESPAPAGAMHDVGPVDPAEVAKTRAMVATAIVDAARNLHEHAHGGNGEFEQCTRDQCVAAREQSRQ